MFVIERTRRGTDEVPEELIVMAGSTGNLYNINIGLVPSCTCPDNKKGNQCKHIIYVNILWIALVSINCPDSSLKQGPSQRAQSPRTSPISARFHFFRKCKCILVSTSNFSAILTWSYRPARNCARFFPTPPNCYHPNKHPRMIQAPLAKAISAKKSLATARSASPNSSLGEKKLYGVKLHAGIISTRLVSSSGPRARTPGPRFAAYFGKFSTLRSVCESKGCGWQHYIVVRHGKGKRFPCSRLRISASRTTRGMWMSLHS